MRRQELEKSDSLAKGIGALIAIAFVVAGTIVAIVTGGYIAFVIGAVLAAIQTIFIFVPLLEPLKSFTSLDIGVHTAIFPFLGYWIGAMGRRNEDFKRYCEKREKEVRHSPEFKDRGLLIIRTIKDLEDGLISLKALLDDGTRPIINKSKVMRENDHSSNNNIYSFYFTEFFLKPGRYTPAGFILDPNRSLDLPNYTDGRGYFDRKTREVRVNAEQVTVMDLRRTKLNSYGRYERRDP
jgi:hypothetical protein